MAFKRRTFLQQTGLAILALGIGETGLINSSKLKRYHQALAETTSRKLALLIGINQYASFSPLKGCVTDVELQRELLINRFGFQPQDIITLTDTQATRENIETAFLEHLVKQAKMGDVVVFHFSGYGSKAKIIEPNKNNNQELVNSLVPIDNKSREIANDLLLKTLILLGRSLTTNKVTMVLDTSYQQANKLSNRNLLVRSLSNPPANNINPEETAFIETLINNFEIQKKWLNTQKDLAGIIFNAAKKDQLATEIDLNGTSAGLFTYYLTQYLWQATTPSNFTTTSQQINFNLSRVTGLNQSSEIQGNIQSSLFTYYILPEKQQGAEGIITGLNDNNIVELKLLGLPHNILQNYSSNSWLTVPKTPIKLQIQSREGLTFQAKVEGETEGETSTLVGQLVQEWIRVLPRNIALTIALDSQLTRIERVDATSAFSAIEAVSLVVNSGEQPSDYLLSKNESQIYTLLDISGSPLPNSSGVAGEAVKLAIKRLETQFNNLLAAKLWNLTLNAGSSSLAVKARLETIEPTKQTIIQKETKRYVNITPSSSNNTQSSSLNTLTLPIGSKIQYRLDNYSDSPVYFLLVGINSNGTPFTIYSPDNIDEDSSMIAPRKNIIFPDKEFDWIISGREGISQTKIIFSKTPFEETLSVLATMSQFQGGVEKFITMSEPVKVAEAILTDLHNASAVPSELQGGNKDIYALDVNAWATFNFIYSISKNQ